MHLHTRIDVTEALIALPIFDVKYFLIKQHPLDELIPHSHRYSPMRRSISQTSMPKIEFIHIRFLTGLDDNDKKSCNENLYNSPSCQPQTLARPLAAVKPQGKNVTLIPMSCSCKIGMQLCLKVSDISTLLNSPSSP